VPIEEDRRDLKGKNLRYLGKSERGRVSYAFDERNEREGAHRPQTVKVTSEKKNVVTKKTLNPFTAVPKHTAIRMGQWTRSRAGETQRRNWGKIKRYLSGGGPKMVLFRVKSRLAKTSAISDRWFVPSKSGSGKITIPCRVTKANLTKG